MRGAGWVPVAGEAVSRLRTRRGKRLQQVIMLSAFLSVQ
jgi:hypothetical protein